MGQRFIWVLFSYLCNSSWMPFQLGPFKGCYSANIISKRIQYHLLGWINRGMIEKARQDLVTNRQIIRQIRVDDRGKMPVTGKYIPRGERDVIRHMMACCPEHPKWDQNPKFIPLSKTTSIPTPFICRVTPPPGIDLSKGEFASLYVCFCLT